MNTNITEKIIIDECRVNNRKFQKILFEKYYGKIMGVCIRYSKDEFQAKDYLQESFIKIFNKLYKYDGTGSFGAWITTLTRNHILDQIRKNKTIYLSENEHYLSINKLETEEEEEFFYSDKISHDDIIGALQNLTECQRAIFNLFIVDGKSHDEISKILNIKSGTSKSNLHKAKKNLKKLLKNKIE
jgi:RNA polymerase sigma-70 factor, ECF subfamily